MVNLPKKTGECWVRERTSLWQPTIACQNTVTMIIREWLLKVTEKFATVKEKWKKVENTDTSGFYMQGGPSGSPPANVQVWLMKSMTQLTIWGLQSIITNPSPCFSNRCMFQCFSQCFIGLVYCPTPCFSDYVHCLVRQLMFQCLNPFLHFWASVAQGPVGPFILSSLPTAATQGFHTKKLKHLSIC